LRRTGDREIKLQLEPIAGLREPPSLDVVVPCHNEQEVLPESYRILSLTLNELLLKREIRDWRLILVDNGSTDGTLDLMRRLFEQDPRVVVVSLRRNFGFQGSLSAGLSCATGDATVSIDADLQDPPEKIPEMVARYREGYDLVLGVRANRKEADGPIVRFLAWAYYRLARALGTPTVPQHGDFRLMSRGLVRVVNAMPERNRFLRTMIAQIESRYAIIYYSRRPRRKGRSKHNFLTVISVALDGVIGFGYQPLRMVLLCGAVLFGLSAAGVAWMFLAMLGGAEFSWPPVLLACVALMASLQLLTLGIVGEYVGRIFVETRGRPPFLIREIFRRGDDNAGAASINDAV
jgi:glycosyltransferase involved in cell wall biosynthesis